MELFAEGGDAAPSSPHKLVGRLPVLGVDFHRSALDLKMVVSFPPAGRGGEGRKRYGCSSSSAIRWSILVLQIWATHAVALLAAVIYGRHGGPFISSLTEVIGALHRSSTVCDLQVVCPRRP